MILFEKCDILKEHGKNTSLLLFLIFWCLVLENHSVCAYFLMFLFASFIVHEIFENTKLLISFFIREHFHVTSSLRRRA